MAAICFLDVWHLGANDNTAGGWIVTGVYAIVVFLCWRVVFKLRPNTDKRHALPLVFWLALSVAITALGINKQLDLQTVLLAAGRSLSRGRTQHYRRQAEAVFFVFSAIAAGLMSLGLSNLWRRVRFRGRLVILGTIGSLGFTLLRTAQILHIVHSHTLNNHHVLIALEFSALVFLGFSICFYEVWCKQ